MPSSVVARMSYDAAHQVLRVTFFSGEVYEYASVTQEVYEQMKAAESKGAFLNQEIKPRYKYKKVS